MLGICPDATLVDITHDVPAARRAGRRARARRGVPVLSRRHDFPGRRRSRRRLDAPRRSRPKPATTRFVAPDNGVLTLVLDEHAAEARRRADRATLRAADGQPDVRRARSVRAGRGLAGARASTLAALGRAAGAPCSVSTSRSPTRRRRQHRRRGAARRSLRQPDHEYRPPDVRAGSPAAPLEMRIGAAPGLARGRRPTPTLRAGEICALFGSTDHLEIAANGASAAAALDLGRGAPVHVASRA